MLVTFTLKYKSNDPIQPYLSITIFSEVWHLLQLGSSFPPLDTAHDWHSLPRLQFRFQINGEKQLLHLVPLTFLDGYQVYLVANFECGQQLARQVMQSTIFCVCTEQVFIYVTGSLKKVAPTKIEQQKQKCFNVFFYLRSGYSYWHLTTRQRSNSTLTRLY